jgi:hypothetical protein
MTRQSLSDLRVPTIEKLQEQTQAWSSAVNNKQRGVDWQMQIDDARIKLKSIYPKIIS